MRALCISFLLFIVPITGFAASRDDSPVIHRSQDSSYYSEAYSNVMTIVRALIAPRANPNAVQNTGRVSPRTYTVSDSYSSTYNLPPDTNISTKQQYINFLKKSYNGGPNDCSDKYDKYNNFFYHDSTLSGKITAKSNASPDGRLDTTCEFLDYSHWCFALGFAYGLRDFDNYERTRKGYRCYTYQEFCENNKRLLDNSKIDEYLSKIIDEVVFYNRSIRNTDKNTVMTTTEKLSGSSWVTSTSWKNYDTDTWLQERIPTSEMVRLLCK